MHGEVFLSLIKSHNRGLKEALVEFKSEEKGYTANVDYALVCHMILGEQNCPPLC